MTDLWQDLVQQSTLSHQQESNPDHYFAPLPQYGILQITGGDAASFLQNLLTNNVDELAVDHAQISGFCNAKGRLFSIFTLIRRTDGFQIVLPKSMCTLLKQRLSMYILRSDVNISDDSDSLFCVGAFSNSDIRGHGYVQHPNDSQRALYLCDQDTLQDLLNSFKQHTLQLAPQNIWEQLDITTGIANIWPESKEKFTPQQVDLDLVGGVSFSKGCYPGQEVVARLHYLGQPSRRLFKATADTNLLPNIADEITTSESSIAGHVVSAQLSGQSVNLLLSLKLRASTSSLLLNNTTPINVELANEIKD